MGGYKEHKIFDMLKRKIIIIKYIVFISLIFIITTMLISKVAKKDELKNIIYVENSNLDYKVYLKENDFFNTRYLEKNNQYIASLIDYIEANFTYELEASKENIDSKYAFKIVAEVNVKDKVNHNSLYKFTEELKEDKGLSFNTKNKLRINEPIKIDYNRYNDIVNRFVNMYDLNNSNSTVTVNMYVNLTDNAEHDSIEDVPVISLNIPLTTKTMAIDFESNEVNASKINVCTTMNGEKYLFGAIVLFVIDIVFVIKLIIFIKDTKDEKSIYRMRLKKIMSNYGSYIQKLNNEFIFDDDYQILEIKSFEDLLQVRETINKPILMTEKILVMETYFFIPSEKNVYVYELKAGNLRANRGKRYKTRSDNK